MKSIGFSFLLALSIVASPIVATPATAQPDLYQKAYAKGARNGAVNMLAASMAAFGMYVMATAKNGLYIPERILKRTGYQRVLRMDYGPSGKTWPHLFPRYSTEPVYMAYENDLYHALRDPNTVVANVNGFRKSAADYQNDGFLEKISDLPSFITGGAFLITAAMLSAYLYYMQSVIEDADETENHTARETGIENEPIEIITQINQQ